MLQVVQIDNPATAIVMLFVAIVFGIAGFCFGRDAGPLPPQILAVIGAACAMSAFAYIHYNWLWVAASIGVFAVAHFFGATSTYVKPTKPSRTVQG
jgi:hypothetical protein